MHACINNRVPECDVRVVTRNRVHRAATFRDVKKYFEAAEECEIRVVYLDSLNSPLVCDTVKYKQHAECVNYFTARGRYYYVYIRLLRSMLAWSAHPYAVGIQGQLGNHVTIGCTKNNVFDIHETHYSAPPQGAKRYNIIATKTHRYYTMDPKSYQLYAPPSASRDHYAPGIWNDILGTIVPDEEVVNAVNAVNALDAVRGGMKPPLYVSKNRNAQPIMAADKVIAAIGARLPKDAAALSDPSKCAFVRIPYVGVDAEQQVMQYLRSLIGQRNIANVFMATAHELMYSAIGLNALPS